MITNIFFLVLLLFFGINYAENLFTYGHTPETQFWLFFLMTWILIYIGISGIIIKLEKKYFPSKRLKREAFRKWFFPEKHEKKKKYINKKKAYLCMVLFEGGLWSAIISGVIVIYIVALVPYGDLETYLGYNSIIGQIILYLGIWGGAIMLAVGGILGIRGALDETEA